MTKKDLALYGVLAVSLITNAALMGMLANNCGLEPFNSTVSNKTTVSNDTSESVVLRLNITCPGNQTPMYLGQSMWANICFSEYIPAWILDLRYFFDNKASLKGIALQKNQWLELLKNKDVISDKLSGI